MLYNLSRWWKRYLGIAQIKNKDFEINKSFVIENVIYNELLNRGYDVYIAKTKTGKIDFVAVKENKKSIIKLPIYLLMRKSSNENLKF